MIGVLLIILVFLSLGAGAAWFLRSDEGYVLLSFHGWVMETTATGLIIAVVVVCVTAVLSVRLFMGTIALPNTLRAGLGRLRDQRARDAFVSGLSHLVAADFKRAEIDLVRRAADHDQAQLSYLFAAKAARAAGEVERSEQYLALADVNAGKHDPRVALLRAEIMRSEGRALEAIPVLEALRNDNPKLGAVAVSLAEVYAECARWEPLQRLLAATERRKWMPAERWNTLMGMAAKGRLQDARDSGRLELLREVWGDLPRPIKETPPVRNFYLAAMVDLKAERQALELIARAVSADWDAELVLLYGQVEGGDPVSQLANVEQWLGKYGEKPELLLVAGRTCLRNRLWGKARSYLDAAIGLQPTPAAYLELARLCEQTQQAEEAHKFFRLGLELASEAKT